VLLASRRKRLSRNCIAAAVGLAVLSLSTCASAGVEIASIFGPEMILQRDLPVPIWGTAEPGERVNVSFAGQTKVATADGAGRWLVRLDPLDASNEPRTLAVRGAGRPVEVANVRVGEVWLVLAGRYVRLYRTEGAPPYPANRIVTFWQGRGRDAAFNSVAQESYGKNRPWGPGRWQQFSALTCTFSNRLHERLRVPVGIILVRVGSLDATTAVEGFASVPSLRDIAERVEAWYPTTRRGATAYEQWLKRTRQWAAKLRGQLDSGATVTPSQPPLLPGPTPDDPAEPTVVYNRMLRPLVPFAFRGALHTHAEANADDARCTDKMLALIAGLRAAFRRPDMPFAFAQQCQPDIYHLHTIGEDMDLGLWAGHRDRQRRAQGARSTGMIVTADVENYPADVGARFARWALADVYGEDGTPCGPTYRRYRVDGDRVVIEFDGVGKGLMVAGVPEIGRPPVQQKDARLRFFAVAGQDRIFHRAHARIDGDRVVVHCHKVDRPFAVRYAFHIDPRGMNLYNRAGLPASPFRTDEWPIGDFEKLTGRLQAKSADELVAMLGYPAELTSHAAAKALAAKGEKKALPIVKRLLNSPDPDLRCGALRTLGYLYWMGPVERRRYYSVPPQPVTPAIAKAIEMAATAADDPDPWVRHCTVEALGLIGSENDQVFQVVRKLAVDNDPRIRTAAARLSKYRLKTHAHNTGIAYALLNEKPFGDRTSAALAANLLNHYRLKGPIDTDIVGRFLLRVEPGQGGDAISNLGDMLLRVRTPDGIPSLNHPRIIPGVMHLYALGCRDYMLYGVERWIAREENIPAFRRKIDELKTEIKRLQRDRPEHWLDRSRRYQDAVKGLDELLKKSEKR